MRKHINPELHAQLVEYMKDYEKHDVLVSLPMFLDGEPIDERIDDGSWSIDDGSKAWSFTGTVDGHLSEDYTNAVFNIIVDIGGIRMVGLNAYGALPVGQQDWSTNLNAATPGNRLDVDTLDEYVTINNQSPERAIRDALYRVPGYNRGAINVTAFGTPLISRGMGGEDAEPGFEDEDHPGSILDSIGNEVDVAYNDNLLGGHDAIASVGTGEGSEVSWEYEVGTREVLEDFPPPTSALPEEQFSRVVARKRLENPNATNGVGPGRRYAMWHEREIDYSLLKNPPLGRATKYITISDTSDDANENARLECIETARSLGRGSWTGGVTVAFNHLLQPQDVVTVGEIYEDDTGMYRRVWRCVIDAIGHMFSEEELFTDLGFTAIMMRKSRLPDPPIVLRSLSPGVVPIGVRPSVLVRGLQPDVDLMPDFDLMPDIDHYEN